MLSVRYFALIAMVSPAPLTAIAAPSSTRRLCLSLEPLIVPPRQGPLRFLSLDLRW